MKGKQSAGKQSAPVRVSDGRGNRTGAVRGGERGASTDVATGNKAIVSYISSLPGWQQAFAKRFDGLVEREIPNVQRAIKWTVPVYGIEGRGWFASFSAFTNYVKLTFFRGSMFKPALPGGKGKEMGFLDLKEGDHLDEGLVSSWIRQGAAGRGFGS